MHTMKTVMEAIEASIKNGRTSMPVLTSNQCHSLAWFLNKVEAREPLPTPFGYVIDGMGQLGRGDRAHVHGDAVEGRVKPLYDMPMDVPLLRDELKKAELRRSTSEDTLETLRGVLRTVEGELEAAKARLAQADVVKALEDHWVDKNGGYHPDHTVEKWIDIVKGNCTRSGYWEWVQEQINFSGVE